MQEKSLALLVIAFIAALLISGGVYLFRDDLSLTKSASSASAKPVQWPAWPPPAQPKHRKTKASEPQLTPQPEERARLRLGVFESPVLVRQMPRLTDVPVNMSMPELVSRYGEPDVMATWSSAGRLNRKLIYTDGGSTLEVNVQNGLVTSARNN